MPLVFHKYKMIQKYFKGGFTMETKIVDDNVYVVPNKIVKNFNENTLYTKRFDIGLCSTCNLANICTLPPRQKEQRVVHCEEFDEGYTVEPSKPPRLKEQRVAHCEEFDEGYTVEPSKKDFFPHNKDKEEASSIRYFYLSLVWLLLATLLSKW